jgi:predicted nucleic acid-binding protein
VILVDSSVWIDYLRGIATPQTDRLDALLGSELIVMGDLVLTEVLQGCVTDRQFNDVRQVLDAFELVTIGGADVAVEAARNYRRLRALGVTVRKTVDTLIATRCLVNDYELLHSDRDFEPFAQHLGLRCVACEVG